MRIRKGHILFFIFCVHFLYASAAPLSYLKAEVIEDDEYIDDLITKATVKRMLETVPSDTSTRSVTIFDKNLKSRYSGDEFDYSRGEVKYSFWNRIKRKLVNFLKKLFGYAPDIPFPKIGEILIRILSAVILIVVLYFAIRIFVRHKGKWLIGNKNKELKIDINDTESLIQLADFSLLIESAEKNNQYRNCVRLYFLWFLKKMKDKSIIEWLPDKTNTDYFREIKNENLKSSFSYLSYLYDYVWYGEYIINKAEYLSAKQSFTNVLQKEMANE